MTEMRTEGRVAAAPAAGHSRDMLHQLMLDVEREQARLKGMKDPSPEKLHVEMVGTVMDIQRDIVLSMIGVRDFLVGFRNWTVPQIEGVQDRLDEVEVRIEGVEGEESRLTAEDAELLSKIVEGGRYFAELLLQGPFPIGARDKEGQDKLAEYIAFCDQAKTMISENTLMEEPEDEEAEDESDGEAEA